MGETENISKYIYQGKTTIWNKMISFELEIISKCIYPEKNWNLKFCLNAILFTYVNENKKIYLE